MKYVKATAQVVRFDNSDVITTSGDCIGLIYRNNGGYCPLVSIFDEGGEAPGEF